MKNSKRIRKAVADERGYTLAIVIMVLLIVSVLGVSVMGMSLNSVKMSAGERKDQAAYYIAESGVALVLSEIDKKTNVLMSSRNFPDSQSFFQELEKEIMVQKTFNSFEENQGEKPSVLVEIVKGEVPNNATTRNYTIISTGKIGSKDRKVASSFSIEFQQGKGIVIPSNAGIYAKSKIELNNGSVKGNIIFDSSNERGISVSGNPSLNGEIHVPKNASGNVFSAPQWWINSNSPVIVEHGEHFEFPLPDFPEPFPTGFKTMPDRKAGNHTVVDKGNINITHSDVANYTLSLDDHYKFNNINFNSNRRLTFNVGSKDISIVVNKIEGGGNLHIEGTGTLTIYLIDNISLSGALNPTGRNNLYLYVGPSSNINNPKTIESSNYAPFNAAVYAKDANIKLTGSAGLNGHIITGGKSVSVSGSSNAAANGTVVYAPNAMIDLTGSGKLYGSVISDSFKISGGGHVEGREVTLSDHPFFKTSSSGSANAMIEKQLMTEID